MISRASFQVLQPMEVRWGDMDAFGHLNNAKYFTYCESARIRYFQEIGLGQLTKTPKVAPVVVAASCNFRRQVRFPADLEVGVRASRLGTSSSDLEYGIFRAGTDELAADGTSVVVWVDYRLEKAAPLPDDVRARIRELDGI